MSKLPVKTLALTKDFQTWKSSSDYTQILALMATYHWGSQLYENFNQAIGYAKLKGPWVPIIPSLSQDKKGQFTIQIINTLTNQVKDLSLDRTNTSALADYLKFRDKNQLLVGNNDQYKVQNLEVGFKTIFTTLKSKTQTNQSTALPSKQLQTAIKLQTYLGLHTKQSVKIFTKGTAALIAMDALSAATDSGEALATNFAKAINYAGSAIDLVFSVFSLGFDVYRFVETEDAFQRSEIAAQIGFDTTSSVLTLASISGALFAAEGSTFAAASAALGPIGVVFSGIAVGVTGLIKAFNSNNKALFNVAEQFYRIYNAYKDGGYSYDAKKNLLQPIAGAVIKKIDLRTGEILYGNQTINTIKNWRGDGGGIDYDAFHVPEVGNQTVSLREALGWKQDKAQLSTFSTAENLLLPFSPAVNVFPNYNTIGASTYRKSSPQLNRAGEIEKHKVLFRFTITGNNKGLTEPKYYFQETPIDVNLNSTVKNVYVPELPYQPYYANLAHRWSDNLSAGVFVYKLHGAKSTCQVYLRDRVTIELNSDPSTPSATKWILYYPLSKLGKADFTWDTKKKALQIKGATGVTLRSTKTVAGTVLIIDKAGDQRVIDFDQLKVSSVTSVDANKYKNDLKSLTKHLDDLYKEAGTMQGAIVLNNFTIQGKSYGRAWYDGNKKKLLYATTPNPIGFKVKEAAQMILALGDYFYCYEKDAHLVWKVNIATHKIVMQYKLKYSTKTSSITKTTVNPGSISIYQNHTLANGHSLILVYQLLEEKIQLIGIQGKVSDTKKLYQTDGQNDPVSLETKLDHLLLGNANTTHWHTFTSVPTQTMTMGSVVTILAQEDQNTSALHKCWVSVKENKLVKLTLSKNDQQPTKGKNNEGVPNDILMVGTIKNLQDKKVHYFFSVQFKKLYALVEGEKTGKAMAIDNLASVTLDNNRILIIQNDGRVHSLTRKGDLLLLGVGKKWISNKNQWWKELDKLDEAHANLNRIILLLGITKNKGKNKKYIPGWYHRDFKTIVFAPQSDSNPELRYQGYSEDGKGAWFFDSKQQRAYFQPITSEATLAKAFQPNSSIAVHPEVLPAALEILKTLKIKATKNIDGKLAVQTVDGLALVCTPQTTTLIQVSFSSVQLANIEQVEKQLVGLSGQYAHQGVIQVTKNSTSFGWFHVASGKIIARNPGDSKATYIGYDTAQKLTFIYSPKKKMLYQFGADHISKISLFKAEEMRRIGKSLFISVGNTRSTQVLPKIDGIDYVYIYNGTGEQNYDISTATWKHYKGIAIDNWTEDKQEDYLNLDLSKEDFKLELQKVDGDFVFKNPDGSGAFLAAVNVFKSTANETPYKYLNLKISNKQQQLLTISMQQVIQAVKFGGSPILLDKGGLKTPTTQLTFLKDKIYLTYGKNGVQQKYEVAEFNNKLWMVENLAYIDDTLKNDVRVPNGGKDDKGNPDPSILQKYGRLYTWEAAKKACPPGWHLATEAEWNALIAANGGWSEEKNTEGQQWSNPAAYTALLDEGTSGFNARLSGLSFPNGNFLPIGEYGHYWTATINPKSPQNNNFPAGTQIWCYVFDLKNAKILCNYAAGLYYSVRYVKD